MQWYDILIPSADIPSFSQLSFLFTAVKKYRPSNFLSSLIELYQFFPSIWCVWKCCKNYFCWSFYYEHHVNGDRPPCTGFVSTPNCKKKCEIGYTASYGEDKHYDKKAYSIAQNLDEIRREMVENGLVEAVFTIYENLLRYEWVN